MHGASEGSGDFEPEFRTFVDDERRTFEYVVVRWPGSRGLVVHCSAFYFGTRGIARADREIFTGYFHRLRMLGSCPDHDWLFLCDAYGVTGDGTYYTGEHGDLFVERAMVSIVGEVLADGGYGSDGIVTVGSSMGATGALVLGLTFAVRGIVALAPHVDLDVAASLCSRWNEVAFACADGEPLNPANRTVTRRVRSLLATYSPDHPPPRLFVQVCEDDAGVYREQVLPLVGDWQEHGGSVELDLRPEGGAYQRLRHSAAPVGRHRAPVRRRDRRCRPVPYRPPVRRHPHHHPVVGSGPCPAEPGQTVDPPVDPAIPVTTGRPVPRRPDRHDRVSGVPGRSAVESPARPER